MSNEGDLMRDGKITSVNLEAWMSVEHTDIKEEIIFYKDLIIKISIEFLKTTELDSISHKYIIKFFKSNNIGRVRKSFKNFLSVFYL